MNGQVISLEGRNIVVTGAAQGIGRAIAGLALDAARKWRFEPAKLDEKPIASELVLNFQFGANEPDGS